MLPNPLAKLKPSKKTNDIHFDDPTKHDGRIRSFEHERGNWTTWLYIPFVNTEIEDYQSNVIERLDVNFKLHPIEDLHISLSKTVVIRHHMIDLFVKDLEFDLQTMRRFDVILTDKIKIYSNEEKTRTFVAFEMENGNEYREKFQQLQTKINNVFNAYQLDTYEEPSYHISFLWCSGDQVDILEKKINDIKKYLSFDSIYDSLDVLKVDSIHCKCGNKEYEFNLQNDGYVKK